MYNAGLILLVKNVGQKVSSERLSQLFNMLLLFGVFVIGLWYMFSGSLKGLWNRISCLKEKLSEQKGILRHIIVH